MEGVTLLGPLFLVTAETSSAGFLTGSGVGLTFSCNLFALGNQMQIAIPITRTPNRRQLKRMTAVNQDSRDVCTISSGNLAVLMVLHKVVLTFREPIELMVVLTVSVPKKASRVLSAS